MLSIICSASGTAPLWFRASSVETAGRHSTTCRTLQVGHARARNPENSSKNKPVVLGFVPVRGADDQDEPFKNAHSSSDIRSRAEQVSIADTSLTHGPHAIGIPFVNTAWSVNTLLQGHFDHGGFYFACLPSEVMMCKITARFPYQILKW